MAQYRESYIYGNTVRQAEPARRLPEQRPVEKQKPKTSPQVKRNRQRAQGIDLSYAIFLSMASIIVVAACVFYLSLQSDISTRSSNITSLQLEISELTMENDAALDAIENSVDLATVKERALALGMVYIDNSQVIEYNSPTADYVKQYESIPESGILAQSDVVKE